MNDIVDRMDLSNDDKCWLLKLKMQRKFQEWLGFEKPCKIPCMCLSLDNDVKPNKSMGTQTTCMGIGNLSTLTLNITRGMGIPEELCSREGIPSLCCVSGYCGEMLSYIQVSYLWSSWREL